ncbi:DUF5665 domain-containing protein [Candidatus Saccharibacteria bacterium]|nr:DUF5665 domain-containing protein [Candidatus Saccharibacteria bacterium]
MSNIEKKSQSPGSKIAEKVSDEKSSGSALTSAQRDGLRALFEDVYVANRWHFARVNFLRGIFFGFGVFIGGTVIVAIVVWFLAQTVDLFPWAQDFTERLINSVESR